MLFGPGSDANHVDAAATPETTATQGTSGSLETADSLERADSAGTAEPGGYAPTVDSGPAPAGGHPADPDDDGHAADQQLLSSLAAEMDAVDAALIRLDNGAFDRCEVCGSEIGHDRLVADPLLTRCPAHA